jgi:hypothetical protein
MSKKLSTLLMIFLCLNTESFTQTEKLHGGYYRNKEYGYSVVIPRTSIGISDPTPLPQHGFQIILNSEPKAYLWVDGSYDVGPWANLDEAVDTRLEWLKQKSTEVVPLRREPISLDGLNAVRSIARYKDSGTGQEMIQDIILTIRQRKKETDILYTLGLRTPESRYSTDKKIFEETINSWKAKPLPR